MSPSDDEGVTQGDAPPAALVDGRQSAAATAIARGVCRLLWAHGLAAVTELALPNGRRADVVGLSGKGEIWIVEIKCSVEDFRADLKWPEYRDFSDRIWFAVSPSFPQDLLPADTGIIVADSYGGELVRQAPTIRLASARRKAMMLIFARSAALTLRAFIDPYLKHS
jgi:hypothetical protein